MSPEKRIVQPGDEFRFTPPFLFLRGYVRGEEDVVVRRGKHSRFPLEQGRRERRVPEHAEEARQAAGHEGDAQGDGFSRVAEQVRPDGQAAKEAQLSISGRVEAGPGTVSQLGEGGQVQGAQT